MPNDTKWLKGALIAHNHQQRYVAGRISFYFFVLHYVILSFKSKYFMLWAPWSRDSRRTKYRPSFADFSVQQSALQLLCGTVSDYTYF